MCSASSRAYSKRYKAEATCIVQISPLLTKHTVPLRLALSTMYSFNIRIGFALTFAFMVMTTKAHPAISNDYSLSGDKWNYCDVSPDENGLQCPLKSGLVQSPDEIPTKKCK